MITSFFKRTASQSTGKDREEPSEPPSKKKKQNKKRNKENGYCAASIPLCIEKMKNAEAGKWRIFDKLEVSYTIITRDWEYEGKKYRECIISPFGMVSTLVSLHSNNRNRVWNTLREEVKVKILFLVICKAISTKLQLLKN